MLVSARSYSYPCSSAVLRRLSSTTSTRNKPMPRGAKRSGISSARRLQAAGYSALPERSRYYGAKHRRQARTPQCIPKRSRGTYDALGGQCRRASPFARATACPRRQVSDVFGIAHSTLYRWLRRIEDRCPTPPTPSNRTSVDVASLVWSIAKTNANWGRVR
jgi:hypothetical protein